MVAAEVVAEALVAAKEAKAVKEARLGNAHEGMMSVAIRRMKDGWTL